MGQIADHVPEPREPRYRSLDPYFDVFAFLETDNWFHSKHVSSLLNLTRRANATVVSSDRVTVGLADPPRRRAEARPYRPGQRGQAGDHPDPL